jgi:hypothetical protein
MIPGFILYALGTACWALMTSDPRVLYLCFFAADLFSALATQVPFMMVMSLWFDRRRGLAVGLAMAGVGLGAFVVPRLAALFIQAYGWRVAYLLVAASGGGHSRHRVDSRRAVPAQARPRRRRAPHEVAIPNAQLPGLTLTRAIFGSWRFWALALAFGGAVVATTGTLTHVVAILTDRGAPLQVATSALSIAGLCLLVGRTYAAWCLERLPGAVVAICFFLIPMAGIGLLAANYSPQLSLVGAAMSGLGIGGSILHAGQIPSET